MEGPCRKRNAVGNNYNNSEVEDRDQRLIIHVRLIRFLLGSYHTCSSILRYSTSALSIRCTSINGENDHVKTCASSFCFSHLVVPIPSVLPTLLILKTHVLTSLTISRRSADQPHVHHLCAQLVPHNTSVARLPWYELRVMAGFSPLIFSGRLLRANR